MRPATVPARRVGRNASRAPRRRKSGRLETLFRTYNIDGLRVMPVAGDVDIEHADLLEAAILADDADTLVLDLSNLRYLDSMTLAVLVRQRRRLGPRLHIVLPLAAKARRIFEIAGLIDALGVQPSLRDVRLLLGAGIEL